MFFFLMIRIFVTQHVKSSTQNDMFVWHLIWQIAWYKIRPNNFNRTNLTSLLFIYSLQSSRYRIAEKIIWIDQISRSSQIFSHVTVIPFSHCCPWYIQKHVCQSSFQGLSRRPVWSVQPCTGCPCQAWSDSFSLVKITFWCELSNQKPCPDIFFGRAIKPKPSPCWNVLSVICLFVSEINWSCFYFYFRSLPLTGTVTVLFSIC